MSLCAQCCFIQPRILAPVLYVNPLSNFGFSGDTFVSLTGWLWHSIKTSKYKSISHSSLGQMFVSPARGYGGERWQQHQPRFHNNTEQDGEAQERGSCCNFSFALLEEVLSIGVRGGEAAFIIAKPWLSALFAGQLETPAWLTCNKPVSRWHMEILWLIKNTEMNNLSPLTVCVWLIPVASLLFIPYLFAVWSFSYRNISWRQSYFRGKNNLFGISDSSRENNFCLLKCSVL